MLCEDPDQELLPVRQRTIMPAEEIIQDLGLAMQVKKVQKKSVHTEAFNYIRNVVERHIALGHNVERHNDNGKIP
ncbi:hypothetical protein DPMN_151164 [Dreissena polymorpha]|uniref:Uncharacterized protein n=1 Tax=Dreissena polymorpha TaxID=45954 RepID=A0A9D4FGM3_DREPO|nr:hypothetical protein DPMN_151164 [Dreissena polymorpha]